MQFRLLAFFPIATGLLLVFLVFASSFVSAVEQAVERRKRLDAVPSIAIFRIESDCDALLREIHALSHEITSCGEDPLCLGSPVFCPAASDPEASQFFF